MREDDLSLLCSGQEDSLHIQDNCVAQNLLLSLDPDNNKLRGRTSIMWGVADLWSCCGNCQHMHCERCTGVHFKQMWLPILCQHLLQKLSHKTHMQLHFLEWQRYEKMAHVNLNGTVSLYLCVGALRLCRNSRRQKEIDEYTKFCSWSKKNLADMWSEWVMMDVRLGLLWSEGGSSMVPRWQCAGRMSGQAWHMTWLLSTALCVLKRCSATFITKENLVFWNLGPSVEYDTV